jgi:23S rRNA (adenine2503-C2)-methyltransferase
MNSLTPAYPHAPGPIFGMTLAEYAAARGSHPQALRREYLQMMRQGVGLELPPITRSEEQDGVSKFCLSVSDGAVGDRSVADRGAGDGGGARLETESVIIPMHSYRCTDWYTLCLSSQVGCRMACTFCETGRMGWLRNLTAAEIVAQRLVARALMWQSAPPSSHPYRYFGDGIQNLVFMGMGEPLDNFDNLVQAIRVLNDPNGLAFPLSQITVSTVGRIDGLRKLAELIHAEEGTRRGPNGRGRAGVPDSPGWVNLRLAISLNAPTDALRDVLMPINRGMPLAELQRALVEYPLGRKGRYLIEYVMLKGVNDAPEHADQVAAWCRPLPCVVNLIPYNPQRDAPYATPSEATILTFLRRLRAQGIFVKRRITHGRDLMGACGQLGNPEVRRLRRVAG